MLVDPLWRDPARFALLRESVRLLPVRTEEGRASEVRLHALQIADRDEAFMPLRAKIHGSPDPGDAARVREYAQTEGRSELAAEYEALATAIDELYGADAADSVDGRLAADFQRQRRAGASSQRAADAFDGGHLQG